MADFLEPRPGFRDIRVRFIDMADGTWAEKIVAVNPDGTNISGGGGGAGTAIGMQVRNAADLAWDNVGPSAGRSRVPVEAYVGAAPIDPRSVRALTAADQVTALGLGVANGGNSSTATLGIGGVFTGTGVDVRDFAAVVVTFISDQAAAFNGIQLQWSPDNANWDVVDSFNMLFTGQGQSLVSPIRGRFFRVVYTNGGTAQGYFRLNTVLKYATEVYTTESYLLGSGGKRGVVDAFGDGIGAQNRLMTDALLRAQRTDTGNQDIVRMTANQNLKVEAFVAAVAIDPRSIRALTAADVVTVQSLTQMNGQAIAMGTGVRTAGTQRVTVATDDVVPVTGTFWQATQPVSIAAAVDVSDRAARLVGVVYGSQGQQLKQTAVNFNQQVEVFVGGSAVDPRSIRALTLADVVSVNNAFLLDSTFTGRFPAAAAITDAIANPTVTAVMAMGMVWDAVAASWRRLPGFPTNADALGTQAAFAYPPVVAHGLVYNGTSWDRLRGSATRGQDVNIVDVRAATLHVTATAAVNTASTATLPAAGAGLFHYITSVELVKLYSVVGVAAGAGVIVTSTNLPGNPAWTTEQLASPAGTATKVIVYNPTTPLKSSVANTATTFVAPLQLQTIWRWNISYFTGV